MSDVENKIALQWYRIQNSSRIQIIQKVMAPHEKRGDPEHGRRGGNQAIIQRRWRGRRPGTPETTDTAGSVNGAAYEPLRQQRRSAGVKKGDGKAGGPQCWCFRRAFVGCTGKRFYMWVLITAEFWVRVCKYKLIKLKIKTRTNHETFTLVFPPSLTFKNLWSINVCQLYSKCIWTTKL